MTMENENSNENFGEVILSAIAQFAFILLKILIIAPFNFWQKAAFNLVRSRECNVFDIAHSQSEYPFLSYIKNIVLHFMFDALAFISYFIGAIIAIFQLFSNGFAPFIMVLIITFFIPMFLSFGRDMFVIHVKAFAKLLSWLRKPAQQLTIDMHNHDKE